MVQVGSSTCGFFGFNGTAGVWRRAAIEEAGKANHSQVPWCSQKRVDLWRLEPPNAWTISSAPQLLVYSNMPVEKRWTTGREERVSASRWGTRNPLVLLHLPLESLEQTRTGRSSFLEGTMLYVRKRKLTRLFLI